MNNVNFPEIQVALLFLHTAENKFGERQEHEMEEWPILTIHITVFEFKTFTGKSQKLWTKYL